MFKLMTSNLEKNECKQHNEICYGILYCSSQWDVCQGVFVPVS